MLIAYRIAYAIVLAVFLGNVLLANNIATAPMHASALLIAAALLLCSVFALLIGFGRIRPAVFWGLVLAWEALFVWYAWFSPASPFALHEVHTLEANAAASESSGHYLKAWALFMLLFAWFLSLPIARMMWKGRAAHV